MKLFQFNPTVRETNMYLSKTVDALLKKYGGVSNEEFEKELISITGISWKQIKNYRNDPKPGRRLKDNSIVVKYIRECQKRDTTRRARFYALTITCVATVGFISIKFITAPKKVEAYAVHEVSQPLPQNYDKIETKVFLQVKDMILRLGPIKHSNIPLVKFTCSKLPALGLTNCSLSQAGPSGPFQATLLMDHDFVRRYSVMTVDPQEIEKLREQLSERVDGSLIVADSKPLAQKQFKAGDEIVDIMSNPTGPGSQAMLNVSVSFSQH